MHFTEYGLLAFLWFRAMTMDSGLNRRLVFLLAVVITGFVGMMDEWYQSFVPTRTMDVFDLMADVTGGLTALTLVLVLRYRRKNRI